MLLAGGLLALLFDPNEESPMNRLLRSIYGYVMSCLLRKEWLIPTAVKSVFLEHVARRRGRFHHGESNDVDGSPFPGVSISSASDARQSAIGGLHDNRGQLVLKWAAGAEPCRMFDPSLRGIPDQPTGGANCVRSCRDISDFVTLAFSLRRGYDSPNVGTIVLHHRRRRRAVRERHLSGGIPRRRKFYSKGCRTGT